MKNTEILEKIKEYFKLEELIDKETFTKYGQTSWQFLDTQTLHCLLTVREGLNKPITVNTWHKGGNFSQRGLRHNKSPMVKNKTGIYLSAHCLGKAFDFDVKGISPVEVREWIEQYKHLFHCKVRLERNMNGKPINWVHLDTLQNAKNEKIYKFDV